MIIFARMGTRAHDSMWYSEWLGLGVFGARRSVVAAGVAA